jgi:DNA repair protein RecO (recombination protein O)
MRIYQSDAIVLRTYPYGEADRIVVFLTEDRGKKRGVAKNASRSRRRFGAALAPLTRGRTTYVEREPRELVRLDRVEPQQTPIALASEAADEGAHRLGHAAYFAELIDEWAPDASPNERLFRLGAAVCDALGRPGSIEALARYFEYWLLRLEGVYPALDICPRCGGRFDEAGAVLVTADRAFVCRRCMDAGLTVSGEALAFLRASATRSPADMAARGPRARLRDLETVHQALIALHLEKHVRSARVVKELRPRS